MNFITGFNRNQAVLVAQTYDELISQNNVVRFIDLFVNGLKVIEYGFRVSQTRVIQAIYSTNWDGEKRLSCRLQDTSMPANVSISYSTTIENGKVIYPVSLIIKEYSKLYDQLISSTFFREYLAENEKRTLSIVYDDNSCFTDKTKEYATSDCVQIDSLFDFDSAVFISLRSESGGISRWVLKPNGQYFMWWGGNAPTPTDDEYYLNCK